MAEKLVKSLLTRKGQNVRVQWTREMKAKKAFDGILTKTVYAVVRSGIDYANLTSVKDGIADGTRGEVQPLPWGTWRKGFERYLIDHKGATYLRLFPSSSLTQKPITTYFVNGKQVEFSAIENVALASEKPSDERPEVFCLKLDTLEKFQMINVK